MQINEPTCELIYLCNIMYRLKLLKYKFKNMSGGNHLQIYIDRLSKILSDNNVSECHGIKHALEVMKNAEKGLESGNYNLDQTKTDQVLLASLLHDADDGKFFPNNHNNENLRSVLNDKNPEFVELVVKMVNIVSSSKNGDTIPDDIIGQEWQLIPRYADRLEAIGIIGIERCYTYTMKKKLPLFLPTTPKPKNEDELWSVASIERYNAYNGNSVSMIDHFYDKLLRLSVFPIRNPFFDSECEKRRKPLIDFILKFGRDEPITAESINEFIKLYNNVLDE